MKEQYREPLMAGLIGGFVGGVISGLLNYFLLPFPATPLDNAIGHGISGFFCGFVSGCVGVALYMFHNKRRNA
jgi:ABC-type antimicrobial peptide transport system permease subunit